MDYIDIAYYLNNLFINKKSLKLIDNQTNTKIYTFFDEDTLIVLLVNKTTNKQIFIKKDTKIENIVEQCDLFFKECNLKEVKLNETKFEKFIIKKVENIYVSFSTEDNILITVEENFINGIPKVGNTLDNF